MMSSEPGWPAAEVSSYAKPMIYGDIAPDSDVLYLNYEITWMMYEY